MGEMTPVPRSRMIAHLNHDRRAEPIGNTQIRLEGEMYYKEVKEIEEKFGWRLSGLASGSGGWLTKGEL